MYRVGIDWGSGTVTAKLKILIEFCLALALLVVAGATASVAQSSPRYYYGLGLGYSDFESVVTSFGGSASEGQTTTLSAVFGAEWQGNTSFYGYEADLDYGLSGETSQGGVTCATFADAPYLCDYTATVRLRGIYGTDFGGTKVFGALGVGGVFGDFATSPTTQASGSVYGLTAGVGAYFPVSDSMNVRGEVIYDNFTNADQTGGYESEFTGMSVRVTAMFAF